MNTIRGFMGVAIESDATRFSGDEFAHERWGAVRGAVRRRRAVRSAGVGSVSVVGAGALVMGVAVVPWGEFSPLAPGSAPCVTPTPSSSGIGWDFEVEQWAVDVADTGTADEWAVWSNDGGVIAHVFVNADGSVLVTNDDGGELVALPDTDGRYVAALAEGGYVVVERPESDGVYVTVSPTAQVLLEQGFAPSVVEALGGSDASYSREVDCVTPSPSVSATASSVTSSSPSPSSSSSASPTPSVGTLPELAQGDSPFQCGFEFTSEEYAQEMRIDEVETQTADAAIADLSAQWAGGWDAIGVERPRGDVLHVTAQSDPAVGGMNELGTYEGLVGWTDPGLDAANLGTSDDVTTSMSAAFVGVTDGRVVATFQASEDEQGHFVAGLGDPFSPETYLLDADGALATCDGDVAWDEFYAVAGVLSMQGGEPTGPFYAWKKVADQR